MTCNHCFKCPVWMIQQLLPHWFTFASHVTCHSITAVTPPPPPEDLKKKSCLISAFSKILKNTWPNPWIRYFKGLQLLWWKQIINWKYKLKRFIVFTIIMHRKCLYFYVNWQVLTPSQIGRCCFALMVCTESNPVVLSRAGETRLHRCIVLVCICKKLGLYNNNNNIY